MVKDLININDARNIINSFDRDFTSHEFIKSFRNQHQEEYWAIVERYTEDADRKANSLIARFLSDNTDSLPIEKVGRVYSNNDHNNITSCAIWRRH